MDKNNYIDDIAREVKNVNDGVTNMIIPILKDTISDYKTTFKKMFIIIILLILGMLGVVGYSQYLIAKQNEKFNEFLNQFDFESTIYQETTDNSIINSGINIDK